MEGGAMDYIYTHLPQSATTSATLFPDDITNSSYKRLFNRSLCRVILGCSILLVIAAVLGIVAVAIYLGMITKDPEGEKYSAEFAGRFLVRSGDSFHESLLDEKSSHFKKMAERYRIMLSDAFEASQLSPGFHHATVDAFRNGSLQVFFRIHLDRRKLSQ
ncbi:unnamed protein product [Darwinula stevensoni]|uniref:SEA domain-containing protein n=1 Tax=Darwinula stevensoni TaxID=69355 RepID=A0A7R9AJN9_9CRUS|nr:unnamed protein product [Darwinula stevensoni]CAG0908097.1 unnamed protein product [Darwinula stevensoni]